MSLTTGTFNLPDTAQEINAPSAIKRLQKLHKMCDRIEQRWGVCSAHVIDASFIAAFPDYEVTHYMTSPLVVFVLIQRKAILRERNK